MARGVYGSLRVGTCCLLRCLWAPEVPAQGWPIWVKTYQSSILLQMWLYL